MYKLPLYLVLTHPILGDILDHPSNRTTSLCPNGCPDKWVPLYYVLAISCGISVAERTSLIIRPHQVVFPDLIRLNVCETVCTF